MAVVPSVRIARSPCAATVNVRPLRRVRFRRSRRHWRRAPGRAPAVGSAAALRRSARAARASRRARSHRDAAAPPRDLPSRSRRIRASSSSACTRYIPTRRRCARSNDRRWNRRRTIRSRTAGRNRALPSDSASAEPAGLPFAKRSACVIKANAAGDTNCRPSAVFPPLRYRRMYLAMSSGVESTEPAGSTKSNGGDSTSAGCRDPGRSLSRHWYPTAAAARASGVKMGELEVMPSGSNTRAWSAALHARPIEPRENRARGCEPVVGVRPCRARLEQYFRPNRNAATS